MLSEATFDQVVELPGVGPNKITCAIDNNFF